MAKKNKGGRPTSMTKETLQKLEQAFSIGASDVEACVYAEIAPATLYNYQEKHPEYLERKTMLKTKPILKARQTVYNNLDDAKHAEWYLERKAKKEFSQKVETEHSGGVKMSINYNGEGKGGDQSDD